MRLYIVSKSLVLIFTLVVNSRRPILIPTSNILQNSTRRTMYGYRSETGLVIQFTRWQRLAIPFTPVAALPMLAATQMRTLSLNSPATYGPMWGWVLQPDFQTIWNFRRFRQWRCAPQI